MFSFNRTFSRFLSALSLFACIFLSSIATGEEGAIHFDFEGNLQGWRVIDGEFENLLSDLEKFHFPGNVKYNKNGKHYLSTLETKNHKRGGNDKPQGIVESPVFKLTGEKMTLLVGGGKHKSTGVVLVNFKSGKVVAEAHGNNSEVMNEVTWNLTGKAGGLYYLQMIDQHSSGWGHVTLDHIKFQGVIDESATKARAKQQIEAIAIAKKKSERHKIAVFGSQTAIISATGKVLWKHKYGSRDGYVLPNGHVIFAANRSKEYPGGAVLEATPDGKTILRFKGTQSEVNSAQPLPGGGVCFSEAGPKPRMIEIDKDNKIVNEFPLACQMKNHHMQTRMLRKQTDGTYLAPHLLNFAVKHYDKDGKVLNEISTVMPNDPQRKIHSWPFTAIKLKNGNILCGLTNGNMVAEFNLKGEIVWLLTNKDLPANAQMADPCGVQRLANGNTVIAPYANRAKGGAKLIEVNSKKEVVWIYRNNLPHGVHHFQVLDTMGEAEPWPANK